MDSHPPDYQPPELSAPTTPRDFASRSAPEGADERLRCALAIAFEEYGAYSGAFGMMRSANTPVVLGGELRCAVCEFTRAERERGTLPEHVIIALRRVAGRVYDPARAPDAFGRVVEKCVRWIAEEYYAPARSNRAD